MSSEVGPTLSRGSQNNGGMQNLIAQTLSAVTLGAPASCEALTMFPLLGPSAAEAPPAYFTLDEALAHGLTDITEISEQGSVPALSVVNKADKPVLILDGEELLGAKQNRVVNLTILVPAHAALTIPVSCVEAGRWRARSRSFAAAPRTQYSSGRMKRMSQVTESIRRSAGRQSDQAEVWADIAQMSARLDAESSTGAMEEMFTRHHDFTERCVEALAPVPGQAGALFLVDGRVVGFDLFDSTATLRRLLPKLVRSVAVDAIEVQTSSDSGDPTPGPRKGRRVSDSLLLKVAEGFLQSTSGSDVHVADAVGMGRDLRLTGLKISGAALDVDATLVHLSAFHL